MSLLLLIHTLKILQAVGFSADCVMSWRNATRHELYTSTRQGSQVFKQAMRDFEFHVATSLLNDFFYTTFVMFTSNMLRCTQLVSIPKGSLWWKASRTFASILISICCILSYPKTATLVVEKEHDEWGSQGRGTQLADII